MTRIVCGVKMTRNSYEDGIWKGTVLGYDITAKKSGRYYYGDFPFSMRLVTLEEVIFRAACWVVHMRFDEIMSSGWNGIYVRNVDGKTTNVFYRGNCIGTYTEKVCSHHIAECLVDNMCLA